MRERKQMKIAIITDMHIGARGDVEVLMKHQKKFLDEIFFPELEKRGVQTILHGGDLFDRRKYINFFTLDFAKTVFLNRLKEKNIEMHIVVGNHDVFYKNTNKINSLELLLKEYENIKVYSDSIQDLVFDNCKIAMVPWITDDNKDLIFKQLKNTSSTMVIGHFEIEGFLMNAGNVCKHGISPSIFNNFETVLSGHFHTPSKKSNIEYIGAPYEMDWSDFNGKRGFYILDTLTKEMEFVENTFKLHNVITFDDKDEELDFKQLDKMDISEFKDSFVKVVVKNVEKPAILDKFLSKLHDVNAANIKVVDNTRSITENSPEIEEVDLENAETTLAMIENEVKNKKLSKDKETRINELFKDLYHEALKENM